MVAQSIARSTSRVGGWVKSEEDPVISSAPEPFATALRGILDLERQVTTADGIEGMVLRYGLLYGPGHLVRHRRPHGREVRPAPLPGDRQR